MAFQMEITRSEAVTRYAGWQVALLTDWMGNAVDHGRIERPCCIGDSIPVVFGTLGTWYIPPDKLTLPGEPMRWLESFVQILPHRGWELSTIAFEVQQPAGE